MKKAGLLLLPLLTLTLSSCGFFVNIDEEDEQKPNVDPSHDTDPEVDPEEEDDPEDEEYNPRMQDRPILHCWNWSMNTIKEKLEGIADAGYKAIQISPMQPQKDYTSYGTWRNEWWKLYQPLGFTIAEAGQNMLGTKSELQEMCTEAEKYDIDVIVDVVSNHLAGASSNGKHTLHPGVRNYEPEIYDNFLIHKLDRGVNDNDIQALVQGYLGDYPDLMTEDSRVQSRVISLLKSYIDVGVDGFRFDAAKHIETENDGVYASNFWKNVLGTTTSYALNKGLNTPFYYGEILYTCGKNRPFSYYTDKMSVTDNVQGQNMINAVVKQSSGYATSSYKSGVTPDKLVLWAESHDTYANIPSETFDYEYDQIIKAYAMQASRKDASSLFFSRPVDETSYMGGEGDTTYKSFRVKAVNQFHNAFLKKAEHVDIIDNYFVNVRSNYGAVLVNIDGTAIKSAIPGLKDGTYVDLVSNNTYVFTSGKSNKTINTDVMVLIEQSKAPTPKPTIAYVYTQTFSGDYTFYLDIQYADKVTTLLNGDTPIAYEDGYIHFPASYPNGHYTITVTAENKVGKVTEVLEFVKTDSLVYADLIVYDVPTDKNFLFWIWNDGSQGRWRQTIRDNNMVGVNTSDFNRFILVEFPEGTTVSDADWSKALWQSADQVFDSYYTFVSYNSLIL